MLGHADPSGEEELGRDKGTCGVSHGGTMSLLGLLVAQHQEGAVVLRRARRSTGQAVLQHDLDTSSCATRQEVGQTPPMATTTTVPAPAAVVPAPAAAGVPAVPAFPAGVPGAPPGRFVAGLSR